MSMPTGFKKIILSALTLASAAFGTGALAQNSDVFLEEIVVTATKRAGGMNVQKVPVAISAYGSGQLDAMHIRDLEAIGYNAPSVQLEDIGTSRGTANFSIRGLGINSSIPSIDPTVGVFVDGMYYGLNAGVVFDIFDLESIEVLRGPQGLLFGRNVTGGAVLMNTTRPTDELTFNAKAAYESGDNIYVMAVAAGPVNDTVGWKLAAYHNDDGGWFTNLANGNDNFGKAETTMVRGALEFQPTDSVNLLFRAEYGQSEGDGPPAQNTGCVYIVVPGLCPRQYNIEEFDFAVDEEGFYDNDWTNLILEANWDVDFGDGTITNILGYRQYESATLGDIDGTPVFIFHAGSRTDQDQISNELRYAGSFGRSYLTTGLYYFSQDLTYLENRQIPPAMILPPGITGGGTQDQSTWAVFAQLDFEVSDLVTLNFGGRYTREEKDAMIATIPFNTCSLTSGCSSFDFVDSRDWSDFTPKVGVQIFPNDDMQIYGFVTKGFRSGGYNMRHTAVAIPNAAFDEEEQTSIEVGMKSDFADGRVRTNIAVYYNQIDDLQRELNLPDPVVGVVQLIRNTADATIKGIDVELSASLTDNFFVRGSLGYVDGEYDEVRFDISNDGVIDAADLALDLPRLAPWSYGGEVIYTNDTAWGSFTAQAGGYHRDRAAYTDANTGFLRAATMIDARISLTFMEDRLTASVFGKNLKDEATIGGDTQTPFFPGSTFSPLKKGEIIGFELQYRVD